MSLKQRARDNTIAMNSLMAKYYGVPGRSSLVSKFQWLENSHNLDHYNKLEEDMKELEKELLAHITSTVPATAVGYTYGADLEVTDSYICDINIDSDDSLYVKVVMWHKAPGEEAFSTDENIYL